MRRVPILLVGIAVVSVTLLAQTPRLEFEVASVKPNTSGDRNSQMAMQPGGRLTITNSPLKLLLSTVYQVQDFQIVGAPDWTATARFDIQAKAADGVQLPPSVPGGPPPQMQMLRALLVERFKLQTHTEQRDMPTYALVLARSDKRLGARLTPTERDCAARRPPPPVPGERPPCGVFGGFGSLIGGAMPTAILALQLAQRVNRPVTDDTELQGVYDVTLTFMPDNIPPRTPGTPADQPLVVNGQTIDPNAPSLMRALEEQLGLKLESTRGPVDVLVIDHVERPTEN